MRDVKPSASPSGYARDVYPIRRPLDEAALRARLADTLAHEHAIRTRARDKYASVSVQAPHEFHTMVCCEVVSPRRVMDVPDLPGDESSDWKGAVA
jgi:hypothetical protein